MKSPNPHNCTYLPPRLLNHIPLSKIEDTFTTTISDLHVIVVLDSVTRLTSPEDTSANSTDDFIADSTSYNSSENSTILIQSHDLYGPLPEILIPDNGDRYTILASVASEASKLYAINRVREGISNWLEVCEFLKHTVLDDGVLVGVRWRKSVVFAEAGSFCDAYLELRERV